MSFDLLFELGWRSFAVAGVTLLLLRIARERSAADKSLLADAGILSLLLLPLTSLLLPRIELAPPQAISATMDVMSGQAAAMQPVTLATGQATAAQAFPWDMIAVTLYLATSALLIALLAMSLIRLHRIRQTAHVLTDNRWTSALEIALRGCGSERRVALLTCDWIVSPISWGVLRPVVVINSAARNDGSRIDAIIEHELAHVHRFDWLKLVLARAMTAIF